MFGTDVRGSVHLHEAALERDADGLQAQVLGVRRPAGRDEHLVALEDLALAAAHGRDGQAYAVAVTSTLSTLVAVLMRIALAELLGHELGRFGILERQDDRASRRSSPRRRTRGERRRTPSRPRC
ncbi:MAG: hypothetical protein U0470_07980 [Anaerolineae bacterium]